MSIDQLDIINEMRRNLVLIGVALSAEEMQPAFESLERNGSPWAFSPGDRAQVGRGTGHPDDGRSCSSAASGPTMLFWVGCMGSFDDRAKKITVAFARILQACGISFAILGQEEHCHGDPARRMGNEYLYQMLAKDTIETLDRYEVKTIVTSCPHCFHQIGNEFPQLGGNYEVIHHSTYIERLLAGRARAASTRTRASTLTVAYHDSLLPRPLQRRVRRAARDAPARAAGRRRSSSRSARAIAACAAAPAAAACSWKSAMGKRINVERTEELLATGADTIAVACPFCMTMITRRREGEGERRAGARHLRGRRVAAASLGDGAPERRRSRNDRKHVARRAAQGGSRRIAHESS